MFNLFKRSTREEKAVQAIMTGATFDFVGFTPDQAIVIMTEVETKLAERAKMLEATEADLRRLKKQLRTMTERTQAVKKQAQKLIARG